MRPIKNKKRRDPRYFLHEQNEDDPAQEMRDRIAAHQGVESAPARSGQEVADELGYSDKPDVMSQAAAGDINMLQAFAEILEIAGLNKGDIANELHRLADIVEEDPNVVDQEEPDMSDDEPGFTLGPPKEDPMGRGSKTSALRRSAMKAHDTPLDR